MFLERTKQIMHRLQLLIFLVLPLAQIVAAQAVSSYGGIDVKISGLSSGIDVSRYSNSAGRRAARLVSELANGRKNFGELTVNGSVNALVFEA